MYTLFLGINRIQSNNIRYFSKKVFTFCKIVQMFCSLHIFIRRADIIIQIISFNKIIMGNKKRKFVPISDLVIWFRNPHKTVYAENSVYFKFSRFCTFSKVFLLA
jgi:hypothetical protein